MNKVYTFMAAIGLVMFTATSSSAGLAYATATPGAVMTITPTVALVPGAAPLVFKPSPKVSMDGMSALTGFAHNGVHNAALAVSGGQKYGMASDTNKVYFAVVEATNSAISDITTSTSNFFNTAGNGFSVMQ